MNCYMDLVTNSQGGYILLHYFRWSFIVYKC